MTVTFETTSESDALLRQEAARRGLTIEALARELFAEVLEDLEDATDANQVLANTKQAEWRSLDELRRAVRG